MPSTRYPICPVPVCAMVPPVQLPAVLSFCVARHQLTSPGTGRAELAGPEPQLGAPGDELSRGGLVEADEAVVHQAAEPGRLEQRCGVARVADELAVRVGVGHEVAGCGEHR